MTADSTKVNEAKLMLLARDLSQLCHRYAPDNATESAAQIDVLLTFAAAAVGGAAGLPFSRPQIRRLVQGAQNGLREALQRETAVPSN